MPLPSLPGFLPCGLQPCNAFTLTLGLPSSWPATLQPLALVASPKLGLRHNPTNVHTLRSFIELCNYYRIYVQNFSTIAHPLYALLKKDVAWTWSEKAQEAFNTFKERLSEFPIMRRPDFSKVFILHTNWSALGIGAILDQLDEEGKENVIAYASRSNNKAKNNYSSYEGECLIVVWVAIHFKPYFYGTNFTLYIDHQPIKWLMTNDKLTGKLARWALIL
jgi:hypothetical protein